MLTLTIRHARSHDLSTLIGVLARAWRETKRGGELARVWRARVSASVRATEVTRGAHGWHPHLHVVVRGTLDRSERAMLARQWRAVVRAIGGSELTPDARIGVRWSRPLQADGANASERVAAYIAKLGLELTGAAKQGRAGGRSQWDVARDATTGDRESIALWREFLAATRGRRMMEMDDRMSRAADRWEASQLPEEPAPDIERVRLPVSSIAMARLRAWEHLDPRAFAAVLDRLSLAIDPERELWRALAHQGELDLGLELGERLDCARAPP